LWLDGKPIVFSTITVASSTRPCGRISLTIGQGMAFGHVGRSEEFHIATMSLLILSPENDKADSKIAGE
jgi:hypothetical protein